MSFEMIGGREFKVAARAGVGATLGLLVGALGKLGCCVAMMTLFAVNVILRSGAELNWPAAHWLDQQPRPPGIAKSNRRRNPMVPMSDGHWPRRFNCSR